MKVINIKTTLLVALICVIFIISQVSQVSAFSVRELLGLKKPEQESVQDKSAVENKANEKAVNKEWAKTSENAAATNPQLDLNYFTLLFSNMNEQERSRALSDPELFKQVIESEANSRSTVSAAISNKLEQDKNVEFLMQRGAENILREAYLQRLILNQLPADFPSDDQVSEYFENNKQQFVVPEQIHVWQIFYAKTQEADNKAIASMKKQVESVYSDLKKGKSDFSTIAIEQSEHAQSKALGGYMGLLKTNELLPELKEPLLKLKEGEISKPVESDSGLHILKRGKIISAETLKLEQVASQIRQLLINQANAQLRNAIFVQARKEFPQDITDKKIEEWRLRLRTNTTQ